MQAASIDEQAGVHGVRQLPAEIQLEPVRDDAGLQQGRIEHHHAAVRFDVPLQGDHVGMGIDDPR